jgi:CBS domain-containing protein
MAMKVRDLMTRDVIAVSPETPLRDVAATLTDRRISGVPIVVDGACVGVVSEADLLPKQLSHPPSARTPLEWIFGEHPDPEELRRRAATTAADAMTAPAVTIDPDASLHEAAALMVDHAVNRLPVVADGTLVGILSRADLVRAYLRQDSDIAFAVRERVLRRTMWLDPADFEIEVHDGIVRISGTVDRRTTAGIIERLIGLCDGVVAVRSGIGCRFDDTHLEPAPPDREPGAASIAARDHPRPMYR